MCVHVYRDVAVYDFLVFSAKTGVWDYLASSYLQYDCSIPDVMMVMLSCKILRL